MRTESIAWLIAIVAGLASGVIAGTQQEVTSDAVASISIVLAAATMLVAWILPREPEVADAA